MILLGVHFNGIIRADPYNLFISRIKNHFEWPGLILMVVPGTVAQHHTTHHIKQDMLNFTTEAALLRSPESPMSTASL